MASVNFERLKEHILPLSASKNFSFACSEWDLIAVEITDEFDSCPCGQEIKEHCYIRNRLTGEETYVGNVCINRFMGFKTGSLFDGLKRIKLDELANANTAVIEYAWERGYIHDLNEYSFLKSTALARKLSDKQANWKKLINRRIINQVVVRRRTQR
jgi:hypothetical protein